MPPVYLINAEGTFAGESELIWVEFFFLPITEDNVYFSCFWIIIDLSFCLCLDVNQLFFDSLGKISIGLNDLEAIWKTYNKWCATVAHSCNIFNNGHLETVLDTVALLNLRIEAFSEDLALTRAGATLVIRHVFDECDRWNFEIVKHLNTFDDVDVGETLRGRHNHSCRCLDLLSQGKLDVTRAWREIDDQIIEIAPISLADELRN